MQPGYPLETNDVLPFGLELTDLMTLVSFVVVVLIAASIARLFLMSRNPMLARAKAIAERRSELRGELLTPRRRAKAKTDNTMSLVRRIVTQLKLLQQHQVGTLQYKLTQAGYRHKDAIIVFAFAKLVMPFAGLAAGLLVAGIEWNQAFEMSQAGNWLLLLGMGYFGARLPDILVSNAKQKRHHAIRKALPDALDLMMICAEAGLSLAAALDRVANELGRVSPELADELSLTSVELGFLPDRSVALKHLGERVDIKEIRGFVNVITQTEKYGTPIAQALRVLAKEFRTERMLRAEQKAARLPAMMTVPMIVFILPTLFVIVMAPAIINVIDTMK